MRLVYGIVLMGCLSIPFMGAWIWLQSRIYAAKFDAMTRIRNQPEEEEWVVWTFSKEETETQLRWEHSREFEYKGQMYDIVEMEIRGDTHIYTCYWDKRETRVKKEMEALLARHIGQGPQSRSHQTRLETFILSLYCIDTPLTDRNPDFAISRHLFCALPVQVATGWVRRADHPPEAC